jgi:thymidylate synthase (FAD)
MRDRIPVLDHGYIELLDHMGSDIDIVNAARTSFDAASVYHAWSCTLAVPHGTGMECDCAHTHDHDGKRSLTRQDAGLINFLMRERHGTPFEMVEFKFAVKAPIFVFREWHRHRIASINEMSGRYVELEREFYIPHRNDMREQLGKPGAYYYERIENDDKAYTMQALIRSSCDKAFDTYEVLLEQGVAKEVARLMLPVNTYSKMVWKTNLRALMNFLSLRNHEHAQREIMYYASIMEQIVSTIVPVAIDAFIDHGRRTP